VGILEIIECISTLVSIPMQCLQLAERLLELCENNKEQKCRPSANIHFSRITLSRRRFISTVAYWFNYDLLLPFDFCTPISAVYETDVYVACDVMTSIADSVNCRRVSRAKDIDCH
jgi:hypothetical protein